MPTIRFAYPTEEGMWGAENSHVDEHTRVRERVRGLAELSPEARAYEAQQAVADGRIAAVRDELDLQDNLTCGTVATAIVVGVGVVGALAVMLSLGAM